MHREMPLNLQHYLGHFQDEKEKEKGFIYGPGRIAYSRKNNKKEQNNLNIERNKISNNFEFIDSLQNFNSLSNYIIKLPRTNLSINKVAKNISSDITNIRQYYNLELRYLRLPNNLFFSKSKPEELRTIIEALLKHYSN
jgi:hypothetical protein